MFSTNMTNNLFKPTTNILSIVFLAISLLIISRYNSYSLNNEEHSVFLISNLVDVKNEELFLNRIDPILSEVKTNFTFIINGDLVNSKFEKNYKKDSLRI